MSSADNKQREWKPASIKVYAGEGRVPIEIMPLLKDPGDELGLLHKTSGIPMRDWLTSP